MPLLPQRALIDNFARRRSSSLRRGFCQRLLHRPMHPLGDDAPNYTINVIPADFAAEASNVIVLLHPALVALRSIRQSAKSADPDL
jgi:hypothetical protein